MSTIDVAEWNRDRSVMVGYKRMKPEKTLDWMLSQNEGQYLEFKQSASDNLGRSICGFANSTGGAIIIGARPAGQIIGIQDPSDEAARVENIARACKPPVTIGISYFERHGKELLLVEVPKSEHDIHQFGSGFFTRIGPMTQAMERSELEEFFWKMGKLRFEDKPCPDFRYPKDFDAEAFRIFLLKAKVTPPKNKVDLLVNMGLALRHGERTVFNNAGVLFFGRVPTRFIRHCLVDCVLFSGWDRVNILDRKTLEGNLIENVDGAMAFLRKHLNLKYEIKGLYRKEILEIPEEALREALLNAIVHRDYLIEGSYVTVEINRDRVEISNPGGLAPGLKPEEFGKKTVRRNPLLADVFQRMGEIEKVGSGIQRILSAVKASKLPKPRFDFTTFFTITFKRREGQMTPQGTPQDAPQVTPQVRKVLEVCSSPKSREEIQGALGLSDREHLRKHYLIPALAAGWLVMTLPDKPNSSKQRYIITEKGKKILRTVNAQ